MPNLDDLVDVLLNLKNKDEAVDLLKGILTPKELEEIPTRLQIVRMLKSGMPQYQIAAKLGIGIATVTRGSKELQRKRFKYI